MSADAVSVFDDIGQRVWASRYRAVGPDGKEERDVHATWRRIAHAFAGVELAAGPAWEERFVALLEDFRFLPGGRIQAGSGLANASLFNCFVMASPADDAGSLSSCIEELMRTMLAGGGVGCDFSNVAPAGFDSDQPASIRSGPVPLLRLWDELCGIVSAGRVRHGAMLGSLRCDHPDIEAFVAAKSLPGALPRFNLSVLVTDEFMGALHRGGEWPLVFPLRGAAAADDRIVMRRWPGAPQAVPCRVYRAVPARQLWNAITRSNYDNAEPGVLFIDRMQYLSNVKAAEEICTTNPCGEVPLPRHGACDLGSFNLTRFVRDPFTPAARVDLAALLDQVPCAVRLLDNVYELSRFPTREQRSAALATRRIGLGFTGLADAFIMLGLRYDDEPARRFAAHLMRSVAEQAYRASIDLAREKGPFPLFCAHEFLAGEFAQRLPADIRSGIAKHGLRNSHLLALAPTGSISLLAGGVSSGIEPVYAWEYTRNIRFGAAASEPVRVADWAWALHRRMFGAGAPLTKAFQTAVQIDPYAQLAMQASLQQYIDNAVSKTLTVAEDYPYDLFRDLFKRAYELGLKGCTTYRRGSNRAALLSESDSAAAAA